MPKPTAQSLSFSSAPPPAPTVPVAVPQIKAEPAHAAPKHDPLPDAVRALLASVPRDLAAVPGWTPAKYNHYLAARAAVEALLS